MHLRVTHVQGPASNISSKVHEACSSASPLRITAGAAEHQMYHSQSLTIPEQPTACACLDDDYYILKVASSLRHRVVLLQPHGPGGGVAPPHATLL